MPSASVSVIIAAAQSVAKVYVIGAVGYFAVKFPRKAPLLPAKAVGTVARFGFHVLVIPLIYSTIANSLTASTIGNYWFVILAAFVVLIISFLTATILAIPFKLKKQDFDTLRISATFPNIVALPILIFPSLCEYRVVYDSFGTSETDDKSNLYSTCVTNSNTMIFLYFFAWSLLFWSFGYRHLIMVATHANSTTSLCQSLWRGVKQTCTSPGFVAMMAGFVTACIPPLQKALFDPGGYLRFLGAAVQTLGVASSPISTMVVAASLVPPSHEEREQDGEQDDSTEAATNDTERAVEQCSGHDDEEEDATSEETSDINNNDEEEGTSQDTAHEVMSQCNEGPQQEAHEQSNEHDEVDEVLHESPIMSDPNFGPNQLRQRSSIYRFQQSIRRTSRRIISPPTRSSTEMRKLLLWFTLSRLIVTPGIVVSLIVALDYANLWQGPNLAKLVIIINAALPGALIVVVLLKSQPSSAEAAAVVAKVYLPSYLLSIVTIAAWTALGLWISLPDQDTAV